MGKVTQIRTRAASLVPESGLFFHDFPRNPPRRLLMMNLKTAGIGWFPSIAATRKMGEKSG
jgi:hypothetical protein